MYTSKMSLPIRICTFKIDHFFDMKSLTTPAPMLNAIVAAWTNVSPALNISWIETSGQGRLKDPDTRSYDGCIGSIQRNESDFLPFMTTHSDLGIHVRPWVIMFADKPLIGTMYNKTSKHGTATRVLDFLDAYSHTHWLLTVILMLVLSLLFFMRIKRKKKVNIMTAVIKTIDMVIACGIKQHTACTNVPSCQVSSAIYTLMTLLSYFSGYFLMSMIKTEMVALEAPATYDTYQDLLDHDVIPMWYTEYNQHETFQFAKKGSLERKIWDRVVERGIDQSLFSVQKLLNADPALLASRLLKITDRRAVSLFRSLGTKIGVANACALMRQNGLRPDSNCYYRSDPQAEEEIQVMPGSLLTSDHVRRHVHAAVTRKVEMGLLLTEVWKLGSFIISRDGHVTEVEECIANVVIMPEHELIAVPLYHYRDLLMLAGLFLMLSVIFLYSEMGIQRRKKMIEKQEDKLWKIRISMNQQMAVAGQNVWKICSIRPQR